MKGSGTVIFIHQPTHTARWELEPVDNPTDVNYAEVRLADRSDDDDRPDRSYTTFYLSKSEYEGLRVQMQMVDYTYDANGVTA